MWNGIFQHTSLDSLTETVKFAERRHQLLASNIANVDTPGYLTQDLSVDAFQKAMRNKIDSQQPQSNSSSSRAEGLSAEQVKQQLHDAYSNILRHDGGNVSLEQQATEISKNQSMHSTAITILRHQLNQLKMAISESVNV
jgi:flagellar basal-body rod protein FlgB